MTGGPELSRLFGTAVHVEVLLREFDPWVVEAQAQEVGARAVLADVFCGDLTELVRLVAPVPVLRPVFVPEPGQHRGVPVERVRRFWPTDDRWRGGLAA
jgi:hypothetical protein